MIVSFWAREHGQPRTTSNMQAVATMLACDLQIRTLVAHTHLERSTLEKAYSSLRTMEGLDKSTGGMDAIIRLVKSQNLTSMSVKEKSLPIIENRLDLLEGPSIEHQSYFLEALPYILDAAKTYYDISFFDVSSGMSNPITNLVLQHSDLIVVNLNQNRNILDTFFKREDPFDIFEGKPILYCIGAYDRKAGLSVDRMVKEYQLLKKSVGYVPLNTSYLDAQNERNIIDFLLRATTKKKSWLNFDEDAYFIDEVRNMGNKIVQQLGLVLQKELEA